MPEFFGRYELLELLGRGGMGEVYRAYDTERQREVALKLLPENLVADEQFTARFRRESLMAAQLSEPHIVPIHDFGEIDGRLYIDMRIVEGEDLGTLLQRRGALPPKIAVDIVRQIASALDAAHARNLVHRDVKPSNIMLTSITEDLRQPPFAYLVDFGIARASDQLTSLTETTSSTVGTIAYMAPERISGDEFDHRSDVYALACVLHESLTGAMPFQGDPVALMFAHMTREPPRPSTLRPGLPAGLDDVVARGLAKDPQQRYDSATALAEAAVAAVEAAGTGPVPAAPPQPPASFSTPTYTATSARNPPPPTGPPVATFPGGPPTGPPGGPPTGPVATPSGGPPYYSPPTTPRAGAFPPAPPSRPRRWSTRRKAIAAAVVAAAAVAVGVPLALSGGSDGAGGTTGAPSGSGAAPALAKGGTLHYALGDTVQTWDPQVVSRSRDATIATRLFVRTLTQLGPDSQPDGAKLEPDLATDTGHASADGKTWTFTLKSGLTWQDGSALTCGDVAYGISREWDLTIDPTFDALPFQLIQIDPTGKGTYQGPYDGTGQQLYDKAVSCSGQTITFHLRSPVFDFNYAVAQPAFAPIKKAQDKKGKAPLSIFSSGPYRLEGAWTAGTGGTFVRNEHYDPSTDDTAVRRALPDTIVVRENVDNAQIYQQLLADTGDGATTITSDPVSSAALVRAEQASERFTNPPQGFVNFVVPNFTRLKNPLIRQALVYGLDQQGYITARGGTTLASPVFGVVPSWLGSNGGYRSFHAYDVNVTGDAAMAQSLLIQAGVKGKLPLRFVVRAQSPTSVLAGARALAIGWNNAGFNVTVDALPDSSYGPLVEEPANSSKWDLTILAWGPDYGTASSVIPSVFDSRQNLSTGSNGADLGRYSDNATNAAIDKALATADATSRNAQWAALDESLAKQVAYIPLDNPRSPRLHGSKVTNYSEAATATFGFPDLGQIGVST